MINLIDSIGKVSIYYVSLCVYFEGLGIKPYLLLVRNKEQKPENLDEI